MSQLHLLSNRRFWPFFFTQFFGAFNDNVFKNALAIMVAFRSLTVLGLAPGQVVVLSSGIFILPFFLFSATAGQLADKYEKATLMRWVKLAEIPIMLLAATGFVLDSPALLLGVLFLMGTQSSFFGPTKYSVLPELLETRDLVGGNALVETGTFVAILLGTIAGGLLVALGDSSAGALAGGLPAVAVLGFVTSTRIVRTGPRQPDLKVSRNPVTPMLQTFRVTRGNRPVFLSVLGISWFWFVGASLLSVLPSYVKDVARGDEHVVTFFLALFCVGIASGSLLCERLSRHTLELGLVPLGSLGLTLFALDLFFIGAPTIAGATAAAPAGVTELLSAPTGWRLALDFFLFSVSGGFFTVPLYTMIQQRSDPAVRSRVIAGNNILNALFMVVASLLLMALFAAGVSIPQVFGVIALLNLLVAWYIYQVIPEFMLRFVVWMLANVMYRVRVEGRSRIPSEGPAVLVCNHVSFVDWLLVAAACPRPARFVMYHGFLKLPLVGWLFRDARVIPIAPARESADTMEAAFDTIAAELDDGEIVCIFPEGKLTPTGELEPFKPGIERILARTPVPVVPMAIEGMWGSFFSHRGGNALKRPFRRFWSRVRLAVGEPLGAEAATAAGLQERVAALLGEARSGV